MATASSRAERSADCGGFARFLALADQVLMRFLPHVLLTYGGHPASLELMRRDLARAIAVVFHLHNFGFNDQRATEHAWTPAVENRKQDSTARSPFGRACKKLLDRTRTPRIRYLSGLEFFSSEGIDR
jgi:hypothetical protein